MEALLSVQVNLMLRLKCHTSVHTLRVHKCVHNKKYGNMQCTQSGHLWTLHFSPLMVVTLARNVHEPFSSWPTSAEYN